LSGFLFPEITSENVTQRCLHDLLEMIGISSDQIHITMLELFRKYSLLAIIVLILLFVGLIFMVDGVGRGGLGSGPKAMSFDGKEYTQSQVERQGVDFGSMCLGLLNINRTNQSLYPYLQTMGLNPRGYDPSNYLASRYLLKKISADYGVSVSEEQVEEYIKGTLFVDPNGEFDQAAYSNYIENVVKRAGHGVQEFNDLVGEIISVEKIKGIVGEGYSLNEEVIRQSSLINLQEMTYEQFSLPLAELKEKIEVTEEEVKAYWEENKGNYLTDPEGKVEFVISDANLTVKEAEERAAMKEKARAEGKTEEEIEKITFTLPQEKKDELINTAGELIDNLFDKVQEEDGENFAGTAEQLGLSLQTSEFFTASAPPTVFTTYIPEARSTIGQQAVTMNPGQQMSSISDIAELSPGSYLIFKVIEKKEAEEKPFEDAKEQAEKDLITKRATDSLEEEVEKMKATFIEKSATEDAGKVALELGLLYAKHEDVTIVSSIPTEPSARILFEEAIQVAVNEFSEPLIQDGLEFRVPRAVFVRPLSRAFIDSEENKTQLDAISGRANYEINSIVFYNWFQHQLSQGGYESYSN